MKIQELINLLQALPDKNMEIVIDLERDYYFPIMDANIKLTEKYNSDYLPLDTEEDKIYNKSIIKEVLVLS